MAEDKLTELITSAVPTINCAPIGTLMTVTLWWSQNFHLVHIGTIISIIAVQYLIQLILLRDEYKLNFPWPTLQ
jgi:hypothetical protein